MFILVSAHSRPGVFSVAVAIALSACAPPDRPSKLSPSLPAAALAHLAPDSLRALPVGNGVFYHYAWSARGPWAVHLLSADLTRCEVDLVVVPAVAEDGVTRVRMTVTNMLPPRTVRALGGVNGDFFLLEGGAPVGPEVTASTQRVSSRPAFAWGPSRVPWIGTPDRDGDRMGFGPDTIGPGLQSSGALGDRLQVVGGFPELLDGGRVVGDLEVGARPGFAAVRHPRTAVGFDAGTGLLWLVVVDGRQAPRSAGMSLPELADLFLTLGVDEALNLDGGGSSAMSLRGRLVSRPSDATGERPVGNSLWVAHDPTGCRASGGAPPAAH